MYLKEISKQGKRIAPAMIFMVFSMVCVSGAIAQEVKIIDLGASITPADVNNNGIVVGYKVNADNTRSAVVYDVATGVTTEINSGIISNAVNDSDITTGNTADGAFLFDNALKKLGMLYSGNGISETGLIAGSKANINPYRSVPKPTNPAVYSIAQHSWQELDIARVYPRGTRQGVYGDLYSLTDINSAGFGSGNYRKYGLISAYGFIVTPAFDTVLRPGMERANAINENNFVAGSKIFDPGVDPYQHACLYDIDADAFIDLGTLNNGLRSEAMDINELGQVVGTSETIDYLTSLNFADRYHAFIWQNGQMDDLNSLLPAGSGWILNSAVAINDGGDIVGTGWFNGEQRSFVLTNSSVTPPPPPGDPVSPQVVMSANPQKGKAPLNVAFDGTGSYDLDGQIVSYAWDFGDGATNVGLQVGHTYRQKGRYTATLTVTDNDGLNAQAEVDIRVRR